MFQSSCSAVLVAHVDVATRDHAQHGLHVVTRDRLYEGIHRQDDNDRTTHTLKALTVVGFHGDILRDRFDLQGLIETRFVIVADIEVIHFRWSKTGSFYPETVRTRLKSFEAVFPLIGDTRVKRLASLVIREA